jgi:hypothetical protein
MGQVNNRGMTLLIALAAVSMLCTSAMAIPLTRVQDTLYNANGSSVEGTATIQWRGFTASDGSTVAGSSISVKIVRGVLLLDLTPNEDATPAGTSYQVSYLLDNGMRSTETWVIPASGTPVTVSQVRVSPPPPMGSAIAQAQVNGLVAALDDKAGVNDPNVFSEPQTIQDNGGGPSAPLFALREQGGSNSVGFRIPSLSQSTLYTLPPSDGVANQRLTTDGAGNLFWAQAVGQGEGTAYEIFQSGGTAVTQRNVANFFNGLQVTDNAGQTRTDVQPVYGTTAGTVTQGNDSRLSDARTPLAHASTHGSASSDPVTPESIGALKDTNDTILSTITTAPALNVQGAAGQSAPLQQWLAADSSVLGLISPAGSAFFREMGLASQIGGSVASQFFIIDNLNRFAFTSFAGSLEVSRYDDSGAFKDKALQIFRNGDTSINTSLVVSDLRPTVGATKLTVKAGAGQSTTALQQWQSNAGTTLSSVDAGGNVQLEGTYVEVKDRTAPATPAAGRLRLFLDSSTGELSVRKANGTVISLEAGAVVFHDAEVPGGTINGANAVFTLQTAPSPAQSLQLAVNGVIQKAGVDFTLSSDTITFVSGAIPQGGDELLSWYRSGP